MDANIAHLESLPPCASTIVGLACLRDGQNGLPLADLLLRDPAALVAFLSLSNDGQSTFALPRGNVECRRWATLLLAEMGRHRDSELADWRSSPAREVLHFSQCVSRIASLIASRSGTDPGEAAIAGLLCPLGWLSDLTSMVRPPSSLERNGHAGSRSIQFHLPTHVKAFIRSLFLPGEIASDLLDTPQLHTFVRAATGLVVQHLDSPPPISLRRLTSHEWNASEILEELDSDLTEQEFRAALLPWESHGSSSHGPTAALWEAVDLSRTMQDAARSEQISALENENERLHRLLRTRQDTEQTRLRELKLRAMAEFAAGAGHEINNPLAVISGHAQRLLRSEENLDRCRSLERIVDQCGRIHEILTNVMVYARPPQAVKRKMSIQPVIKKVVDDLQPIAQERRVQLQTKWAGPAVYVSADSKLLTQSIECLLRNALEAAPADGRASIYLDKTNDDTIQIIFEDNGPALTPVQQEHLFDPFYSGRDAGRGQGLGLPKVWRIVELHNGAIDFECPPNGPSRFVLSLPTLPSRNGSRAKAHPSRNGHARKK